MERRVAIVLCSDSCNHRLLISFVHDRVLQKSTGAVCLVLFVNVHNLTVDLFALRGAGDVIKDVPFAEIATVNQASLRA